MRRASSTATEGIETPFSPICGLLADAAAGGERAAEEAVEDRPGGALDQRQLVGAFDLALDLGLADDHRVEPGGDPEEVVGGVAAAARVEVAEQLGGRDLRLAGEDAERRRLGFDRVGDDQVELGAVAGRDRRRLVDALGGGQLAQGADGAALGQREPLAQVERRRLVGDAEGEQLAHPAPTSSGSRRVLVGARGRFSAKPASSRSSLSIRCSFVAMIAT